jgi:hypothetical protein
MPDLCFIKSSNNLNMKKTRKILVLLTIVFTFAATAAIAIETPKAPRKALDLTLEKAVQNESLVLTMKQQLDPEFLNTFQLVYTQKVVYKNLIIKISGTRIQWQMFFWPCGTKVDRHINRSNYNY